MKLYQPPPPPPPPAETPTNKNGHLFETAETSTNKNGDLFENVDAIYIFNDIIEKEEEDKKWIYIKLICIVFIFSWNKTNSKKTMFIFKYIYKYTYYNTYSGVITTHI